MVTLIILVEVVLPDNTVTPENYAYADEPRCRHDKQRHVDFHTTLTKGQGNNCKEECLQVVAQSNRPVDFGQRRYSHPTVGWLEFSIKKCRMKGAVKFAIAANPSDPQSSPKMNALSQLTRCRFLATGVDRSLVAVDRICYTLHV